MVKLSQHARSQSPTEDDEAAPKEPERGNPGDVGDDEGDGTGDEGDDGRDEGDVEGDERGEGGPECVDEISRLPMVCPSAIGVIC